jgi:hypothetical protein
MCSLELLSQKLVIALLILYCFANFFFFNFLAPPPEKTFPIKSMLQAYGGPRVRGDDEARPGSAVTSLGSDMTMREADAMLANYAEDLKLNEVCTSFFLYKTHTERDTHTDILFFLKHTHRHTQRGTHTQTPYIFIKHTQPHTDTHNSGELLCRGFEIE